MNDTRVSVDFHVSLPSGVAIDDDTWRSDHIAFQIEATPKNALAALRLIHAAAAERIASVERMLKEQP